MTPDLIIGLDSSTQSTKAIAWTRHGDAVAEGRAPVPLHQPQPGFAEQSVDDWCAAADTALGALLAQVDPARIAGLAISNQRETVAFLAADGRPTRPAIVWLDERAQEDIGLIEATFGPGAVHAITGKPADITPVLYRLNWLKRHTPQVLADTAQILDVHGVLTRHLTGQAVASWTSADPFGVFDIAAKAWSAPILAHLGLSPERFGTLARPGSRIGTCQALLPGVPVFAAGGDGQCAGLGVNAARPGVVYLNLGTAIITGAWSATPAIGRHWRTMTSPTGEGFFLEGVQRAGAFLVNWFIDTFAGGRSDPGVFARLESQAAALPVGSLGVTVCPYLSGCMDPHWDPAARASFHGLGPQHGPAHLYRALLEALTLESARCITAMQAQGVACERILAVGGGGNSALWIGMLADATGLPVTVSRSLEASSLGAAMSAAVGLGWHPDFDAAARGMSADGPTRTPDPATRPAWDALSRAQAQTYRPNPAKDAT